MPGVAFFDVDHTLTRRSSGGRFVGLAMRRGVLPRRLLFAMAWFSVAYQLGVARFSEREGEIPWLRGLRRDTLDRLADESFDSRLRGDLFPGAEALVRRLQGEGWRVVLATSSLDLIVQPLARHLGAHAVVASTLRFEDGVCTGRMVGPPMFRGEKRRAVLSWLEREGIPAGTCAFYSDSFYDLPLLESVGTPVAVNPDRKLRRTARDRGWQVIDLA